MLESVKDEGYLRLAIVITAVNVILVWAFRFLPLFDYPIWLYEVHIMRAISQPQFASAYDLVAAPVPNLGFVVPVYLLSLIVSIESAGKIFLTLCVVALPWSFWYCVRKLSADSKTPLAYAAFPFTFSIYFFAGQAFLLGFIGMLLMAGFYVPRLNRLSFVDWGVLSFLVLVCFFIHAVSFVLTIIVIGGFVFFLHPRKLFSFGLALVPSLVCLVWYLLDGYETNTSELRWSFWGLAQNMLKPVFLFTKSYGIPNPLPLTVLNLLWLGIISWLAFYLWKAGKAKKMIRKEFVGPLCIVMLLTVALPEMFFGIVQPGSRFALPAVLLFLLMYTSVKISERWKSVFLGIAAIVTVYNTFHFRQANEQMSKMFTDITSVVAFDGATFCSVRFDWPPERNAWNVAAASVDPLFGVPYYAGLKNGGPAWIFGTSLVRVKKEKAFLRNIPLGSTPDELAAELLTLPTANISVIALVGNNAAARSAYMGLTNSPSRFIYRSQNELWSILGTQLPKSNESSEE